MRHFKEIAASFIVAICVVLMVQVNQSYRQGFFISPEGMDVSSALAEVQDLPKEIQGFWTYDGDVIDQEMLLRGNQLVVRDEYAGTIYYSIERVDALDDQVYTLHWDPDSYEDRYGAQAREDMGEPQPFVFQYNEADDTLTTENYAVFERDYMQESLLLIKTSLTENQPINQRHLTEVDEQFLYETYQTLTDSIDSDSELYQALYFAICEEYPSLELLTREDYERYGQIVQIFESSNSRLGLMQLNQANPRKVLSWAQAYDLQQDKEAMVQDLTPHIEEALMAYLEAEFKAQNVLRIP